MKNPIQIILAIFLAIVFTVGCAHKKPSGKSAKRDKEKKELRARRGNGRDRNDDEDVEDDDPLKRQLDKLQEQQALASALDPTQAGVPAIGDPNVQALPVPDPGKANNPFQQPDAQNGPTPTLPAQPRTPSGTQVAQNPSVPDSNPAPLRALTSHADLEPGPVAKLQSLLEASTHADDSDFSRVRRVVDDDAN